MVFEFFSRPDRLWWLLALPILAAWVARGQRLRRRAWDALGLGGRPVGDGAWFWLAAIGILIVAVAQPRWGRSSGPPLPPGQDVVLLVDASRSMGAEDAVPDRLGVAVESAASLVGALGRSSGTRVAVVAFAGRGIVRCPLTENLGAAVDALEALRPGGVRPGGTDLNRAIEAGLSAFDDQGLAEGRSIVLFTDGEDLVGSWDEVLPRLRASGVVVHAVAIGDPDRAHPVPSGAGSATLIHRGEPVASRRSDEALLALADATGGALIPLGLASTDLGNLYESRIAPVVAERREAERSRSGRSERFPAFVLGALALGLVGSWPGGRRRRRRASPALALGGLVGLAIASGAGGTGDETSTRAIAIGRAAYARGDLRSALEAFERAIALEPNAAVPRYDAGAALFQLGRHAEARDRYLEARDRAEGEPGLRTKIEYALGNTALRLGDLDDAIVHYDACLASRVPGPAYDSVRRDAAANRRFVEEQARPTATESTPSEDRNPASPDDRQRPNPGPKSDDSGPSEADPRASPDPGGDGSTKGAIGNSGRGGGGAGPSPPGSPEARLDDALRAIGDSRRLRLDDPPPAADGGEGKDW